MDTHTALARPLTSLRVVELKALGALADPSQEARRLELILAPASRAECIVSVRALMNQFQVVLPADEEAAHELREGYLMAMEGYPVWTVIETCRAFVRGEVEGAGDFMPKPATLGRELARRVDDWRGKLQRARRAVDDRHAFDGEHHGPRSPETKALGDAYLARARARVEEERRTRMGPRLRAPEWIDPNPITPEMLEGVPDAEPRGPGMAKSHAHLPDEYKKLKGSRP